MLPANSLIPIHDENPTRTFSAVTLAIIIANVAIFLIEPNFGIGSSCGLAQFLFKWGLVPKEITHGQALTGSVCPGVALEAKSIYLSIVTSMFLHGGFIHIAGNMLFLWVFGNNIEDTLGKIKFVIFYFAVGILAALAHVYFNAGSQIPTVGASGAVSGLLGAYIVLFPKARVTTIVPIWFFIFRPFQLPAWVVLGVWFASQFLIGQGQQAGGGVAWVAHVGGFIAGAVLIVIFGGLRQRPTLGYIG